jgi:hypothetical protein
MPHKANQASAPSHSRCSLRPDFHDLMMDKV